MIQLPPLPYALNALEPHISEKTLSFHHGKHHQAYVTNTNTFLEKKGWTTDSLEEIIKETQGKPDEIGLFNNAAQVWNHNFFWLSMKPRGGGKPTGSLLHALEKSFGSYEEFVSLFKQAATTQFGSGWAWLVKEKRGTLQILKTGNAELPMTQGLKALLTCDVWEHAYYLDYQNRRPDYVDTFLTHLVNWSFAEENFNI